MNPSLEMNLEALEDEEENFLVFSNLVTHSPLEEEADEEFEEWGERGEERAVATVPLGEERSRVVPPRPVEENVHSTLS